MLLRYLFTFCVLFLWLFGHTQNCDDYLLRQYDTRVEMDVEYGTAPNYEGYNIALQMNIFKPIGDQNTQRPVLILVHGGGFYAGHRNDMNELASWYAERGYVVATISYRLGFYYFPQEIFAVDQHEMVRAIYRGMQDCRGAIRFLKGRAAQDSTDINKVAVLGASAGGFIALHTAYMDKPEEKPMSCNEIAPVLFAPRPDLGPVEGTMNINGQTADVRAVVNIFGGIRDTSLIEGPTDPPLYAYHQTNDGVVSCNRNKPYWALFPDTNNPVVEGSCVIQQKTNALGFAPEDAQYHIYEGNEHDIHDPFLIDSEVAAFLNFQLCNPITSTSELKTKLEVEVFPVPALDVVTVRSNTHITEYVLYNLTGQVVSHLKIAGQKAIEIFVNDLSNGVYLLKLVHGEQVFTQKVVVAHGE